MLPGVKLLPMFYLKVLKKIVGRKSIFRKRDIGIPVTWDSNYEMELDPLTLEPASSGG
jgi:hypothetical protein